MKKIFRIAMVIALSGATLLYTGCTKDYSKQIDDLNTEVSTLQSTVQAIQTQVSALEALKTQVAALQGDVTGLQAAIDKCNATIADIQKNYATKDEVDAAVTALAQEVKAALDDLAQKVAVNSANIEALSQLFAAAYEAVGQALTALNTLKVQSITYVPYTSWGYDYVARYTLKADKPQGGKEVIVKAKPQLYLDYKVRPAYMASAFTSENSRLEVYGSYLPVNVYDADPETGYVSIVADIPEALEKALGTYFPVSFEFCDGYDEGVANWISSSYSWAYDYGDDTDLDYYPYDTETGKKLSDQLADIKVEWTDYATSERKFFEGTALGIGIKYGKSVIPIADMANLLGVDVATITPKYYWKIEADKAIKADEENLTAKMAATTDKEALAAVGKTAIATIWAYFSVDYETSFVSKVEQTYKVVPSQKSDVTVEAISLPWAAASKNAEKTFKNLTVSSTLPANVEYPLTVVFVDENGTKTPAEVGYVKADEKLCKVVIKANAFEFEAAEQNYTAFATVEDATKQTYYYVYVPITIGARPADKEDLNLGTYTTPGSFTEGMTVKLDGALNALLDGDDAMFFSDNTGKKIGDFASAANASNFKLTKVVWTDAKGHAIKLDKPFPMTVTYAYDATKKVDASTIVIPEGYAIYGSTFQFFGSVSPFEVEREYTFTVAINDFDAKLITTGYVSAGNVIEVTGEIPTGEKQYIIDDINLDHYFKTDKAVDKDALSVVFNFDRPTVTDPETGEPYYPTMDNYALVYNKNHYCLGRITGGNETDFEVPMIDDGIKLQNAYIDWNFYQGRELLGTATLAAKVGGKWFPVCESIDFTIKVTDPITTFHWTPVTKAREVGKSVSFDTIEGLTIVSTAGAVLPNKAGADCYGIIYGSVDADGKWIAFEDVKTIEGTVNGVAETFTVGTDFKFEANDSATAFNGEGNFIFKENNAKGKIVFNLPIAIKYNFDNREKKLSTAVVTFDPDYTPAK